MKRKFPIEFHITPEFCILGALLLLVLPLRWLIAAAVAAMVHECCHLAALRLCRLPVLGIRIGAAGMQIEAAPMHPGQELFCAAAGPAGSFLLMLLIHNFPILGIFAGIQGIYNLIPVYPADGGRILSCILIVCCPENRDVIMMGTRYAVILLIAVLSGYCIAVLKLGCGVLLMSVLLFRKLLQIKRPCKEGLKRVQ